jgi:hypothetical protein
LRFTSFQSLVSVEPRFKLDHVVAVERQIRAYCPAANSADRNLSKKA